MNQASAPAASCGTRLVDLRRQLRVARDPGDRQKLCMAIDRLENVY
jgi:hypothetical protein